MGKRSEACPHCGKPASPADSTCSRCAIPLHQDFEEGVIPQSGFLITLGTAVLGMMVCYHLLRDWQNPFIGVLGALLAIMPLGNIGWRISRFFCS